MKELNEMHAMKCKWETKSKTLKLCAHDTLSLTINQSMN